MMGISEVKESLKCFGQNKRFAVDSMDLGPTIKEKMSGTLRTRSCERL